MKVLIADTFESSGIEGLKAAGCDVVVCVNAGDGMGSSLAHAIRHSLPDASAWLIALADSLAEFSERGREAGDGRREMTIVPPYILRYRVEKDRVVILRIRHGAREEDGDGY